MFKGLIFPDFNKQIKTSNISLLTAGSLLLVVASWLRAYFAQSIMVDEHAMGGFQALFIYLLFGVGLTAYSLAYYRLWKTNALSIGQIRILFYGQTLLLSLMLPFLSNDVFSLLTYGDLANKGVDVFTRIPGVLSAFFSYCNPLSGNGPTVYGPLCLVFLQTATYFTPENVYVSLLIYKIIALLWAVIFIEAAYYTAKKTASPPGTFFFIALNPILLIQGIGQLHSDLMAVVMTACTVYMMMRNKTVLAFIFAALAIAVKMNYILVIPYIFIASYLFKRKKQKTFILKSVAGVLVAVVVLTILYTPYYTSKNTLLTPFKSLYDQVPTKSVTEIVGDAVFYGTELVKGGFHIGNLIDEDGALSSEKMASWNGVMFVCRILAIGTSLFLLFNFFRSKRRNAGTWMNVYMRLLLLFLLFYSHVIYPWYLMMVIPFLWYEKDTEFMTWFLILSCFSNAQTIMCVINRNSYVYYLVVPLIVINVFMFMWRFRPNFLSSSVTTVSK